MVGYVDQKSSRGMKKGREVPRKTKAMTGGWLKKGLAYGWCSGLSVAVRGGRLSPGGKKEHSESRSAAFALDDKAVGPRLTSYPTHHVIGRIGGTRGFRLLSVQLPTLHLSLASWSVRKSWMPSLVTCQRSQTPGRPTISNLHCTFSVQCAQRCES